MAVYNLSLSDDARKFFERASAKLQQRLDRCFEQLCVNPRSHPNIKSLKGNLSGYYRYRVGDYRIVHQIEDQECHILVMTIVRRREVYE